MCVADSAATAHLDGPRRDVDGHGLELPPLDDEAVPAGARADVEHASVNMLEGVALDPCPVVVVGEEPLRAQGWADGSVVALELRLPGSPFEVVEQQSPEGVLLAAEDSDYAASEVRRPSSAAIGLIAATTFVMWSSSSTPSSSAPS